MSRRNFILLIIVLIITIIVVFSFFYFRQTPSPSGEDGTGFPSNLNPFGGIKTVPPKTTPPSTDNGNGLPAGEVEKMQLIKVSTMPIAGYTPFQKEKTDKEFVLALRYVARATGQIYQTFTDEIKERRFSSTVIPTIYEASFGNNGEMVVMRYLKDDDQTIQSFVGTLPKEILGEDSINEKEIRGFLLPDDIVDLSLSPDTTKIFYLLNTNDKATGIVLNLKDNKKTQIFDSPFTEWLSFWPNSKIITLNTKPSGITGGYMYAIDPSKKNLNRVLDNINGLTTLTSPNGNLILYGDNNLILNIYNINTRESTPVGVNTLPEKCVWSSGNDALYCAVPKIIDGGLYPDSWYRGEVSFLDEIWKINLNDGNTTKIINPSITSGEEIDGIKLKMDNGENYLFFVNKKDSYLWELRLK